MNRPGGWPLWAASLALVAASWRIAHAEPVAQPAPHAAPRASRSLAKHFLWRVDSATARVYLVGSIHMLDDSVYPLDPVFEQAFKESDALVLEANVFDFNPATSLGSIMEHVMYTDGSTLREHLSPGAYERAASRLESLGMAIEMLAPFRPWMVALTATQAALQRIGFTAEHGIDRYFYREAEGWKEVRELESVEFQIGLLAGLPDDQQELFLLYSLDDIDHMEHDLRDTIRAWQAGDVAAMEAVGAHTVRAHPEMAPIHRVLLTERNATMARRIEELLHARQTLFVVVGAGHLVGQSGIVSRLRQRGYDVRQL